MIGILIRQSGDAFSGDGQSRHETARIMHAIADAYADGKPLTVRDYNGNTCGKVIEALDGGMMLISRDDYIRLVEDNWKVRERSGSGHDVADYATGAMCAFVDGDQMPGAPAGWVIGIMSGRHPFTGAAMPVVKPRRSSRRRSRPDHDETHHMRG